ALYVALVVVFGHVALEHVLALVVAHFDEMPLRIDAEELRVTFLRVAEAGGPAPRAVGRQRADAHARDADAEALPGRKVADDHLEFAMPTAARIPAEGKARLPLRTRRDNGRVEWLLHGGRVRGGHCQQSHDRYHEEFHNDTSSVLSRVLPAGHISRQSADTGTPSALRPAPHQPESPPIRYGRSALRSSWVPRGGDRQRQRGERQPPNGPYQRQHAIGRGAGPHPPTGRIVRQETTCQMISSRQGYSGVTRRFTAKRH